MFTTGFKNISVLPPSQLYCHLILPVLLSHLQSTSALVLWPSLALQLLWLMVQLYHFGLCSTYVSAYSVIHAPT